MPSGLCEFVKIFGLGNLGITLSIVGESCHNHRLLLATSPV